MKLIFIRHGDPDYKIDGLTEQGIKEAKLLVPRMKKITAQGYFVSPLGRAKQTAELALEGSGIEPEELWWLREFSYGVRRPDKPDSDHVPWDWMPADWTVLDEMYEEKRWSEHPVFTRAGIPEYYAKTTAALDEFLLQHGYKRDARMYRAISPNNDTLVFFCHFGLTSLVLAHLIGISPMIIWQGFISAPTSVTTIVTEERREGEVAWRCTAFGDTSHLYAADMPPGFSGRFCECYSNTEERH